VTGSVVSALLVVAGAMVGAPLRYVTDLAVQSVHDTVFPWGTFTVNVVGSLILGAVAGAVAGGAPGWLLTLIGTGLCGALTTFSTFGFETVRLIEDGAVLEAVLNAAASVVVGLVACMGAFALASAIA
jgi:CrcB protein